VVESEPQTFKEVMSTPEAQIWKKAINNEKKSLLSNNTCKLVNLSLGNKPIESKWIFKEKLKPIDQSINTKEYALRY